MKAALKHASCIALFVLILVFNFFFVGKYSGFPWWHESLNDIDPTISGTTIGLLNNSELQYIYHPGATPYFLNGIAYRALSLVDPAHEKLFHLTAVRSIADASDLLETATRTSRILTLWTTIVFSCVFYALLFLLTRNCLLSFLLSFFTATSHGIVMHTFMVRSEVLSVMFVILAMMVCIRLLQRPTRESRDWIMNFIFTGFLVGFSVFSKIQAGPIIVGFVAVLLCALVFKRGIELNGKTLPLAFGFSALNFLIMPWWALTRPAFMTPEYIARLKYASHELYLYGLNPPPGFRLFVFLLLLLIALFGILVVMALKVKKMRPLAERFFSPVVFINTFVTGMIISAYVILLPVSVSRSQYVENTRHLVYSVFTNIFSGRIMQNKVINGQTFPRIIHLHATESQVLGANVIFFVFIIAALCFLRIAVKGTKAKRMYGAVLGMFAMGLIMDFFGTLRAIKLYEYYACYSIVFYSAGIAVWLKTELSQAPVLFKKINIGKIFPYAFILLFSLHVVFTTIFFLRKPRASGLTDQTPHREYLNTRSLVIPFWKIVDDSILRNQ